MRITGILFAVGALVTGLVAAWYWYRSSRVAIDPGWGMPGTGERIEPVIPELRQLDMEAAMSAAFHEAGRLNAVAARWTAISVSLSGVSSVVGALA